jgi:hypothetical protein
MPARKPAARKSGKAASKVTAKKPASKQSQKTNAGKKMSATRRSGQRRSSGGILDKAREALKAVFAGAPRGAEGTVADAAEAGTEVTGVAAGRRKGSSNQGSKKAAKK